MADNRKNNSRFPLLVVLMGGLFVLLIVMMAKVIGDGPLVPPVFFLGWLVFAALVIKFFANYKRH